MEVESFQQQALSVRMPNDGFDPSAEPTDGEEYLMKVIYERSHCPAVVVKPVRYNTNEKELECPPSYVSETTVDTSERVLRPTTEWKHVQLQDFVALRHKITRLRSKLESNGFKSQDLAPLTNDEDDWKRFCQQNNPLLSTVLRVDQRSLEQLLEFESNWLRRCDEASNVPPIELSGRDNWLGNWIYSTLVCLQLPLEPNVHSVLRDIAKSSILLRNELTGDSVNEARPLNLFIFLISKYFDQFDLADFV